MIAIDILHLVDKLEAFIEQGHHIPLTAKVIVDESSLLDIIGQMRISVPEEIQQAQRVEQECERIIAQAQDDGAQIVAKAREDAARLVADHELRRQAQQRAERMLAEAERQAHTIRQGADQYAIGILVDLAEQLAAVQRTTANGLTTLRQRNKPKRRSSAHTRTEGSPAAEQPNAL